MTRLQFLATAIFSSFQNLTKQPIDIWMQYQYMLWLPFLAKDGRNFCAPTLPGTPHIYFPSLPIPSRLKDGTEIRPRLM